MKAYRKAFSLIEVALVVGILALLAAIFIPATAKIRENARQSVIKDNLKTFITSGCEYANDRGVRSVSYKTLVDSKFLKPFQSVSGEKYDALIYDPDMVNVEVTTSLGDKVSVGY